MNSSLHHFNNSYVSPFYKLHGLKQAASLLDTVQGLLAQREHAAIARFLERLDPVLLSYHALVVGSTKLNRLQEIIPTVYASFSTKCEIQMRHRKSVFKRLKNINLGFYKERQEMFHNQPGENLKSVVLEIPPSLAYSEYAEAEVAALFDLSTGVQPQGYVSTYCGIKEHTAVKCQLLDKIKAQLLNSPIRRLG